MARIVALECVSSPVPQSLRYITPLEFIARLQWPLGSVVAPSGGCTFSDSLVCTVVARARVRQTFVLFRVVPIRECIARVY